MSEYGYLNISTENKWVDESEDLRVVSPGEEIVKRVERASSPRDFASHSLPPALL